MKLYGYYRSNASFRVRIALGLKGLNPETQAIHLRRNGGEQFLPANLTRNPQAMVPVLETESHLLTQSLAIIEYLDETYPTPPLLPAGPLGRARVRALAQAVACDIQPFHAPRVLTYLEQRLPRSEAEDWAKHWLRLGLDALETQLSQSIETGLFCHGDAPGLADIALIPQVFTARRHGMAEGTWPTIDRIFAACLAIPAFDLAQPAKQPDRDASFTGA